MPYNINLAQGHLLNQFATYLRLKHDQISNGDITIEDGTNQAYQKAVLASYDSAEKLIEFIEDPTGGCCLGFSEAYSYMASPSVNKSNWWNELLEEISQWNGLAESLYKIKRLIQSESRNGETLDHLFDRAINYVVSLQGFIPSNHSIGLFSSVLGNITKKVDMIGYFEEKHLDILLDPALFKQDGLKTINSVRWPVGHTCAIWYADNAWFFYNPNDPCGLIRISNKQEFIEHIIDTLSNNLTITVKTWSKNSSITETLKHKYKALLQKDALKLLDLNTMSRITISYLYGDIKILRDYILAILAPKNKSLSANKHLLTMLYNVPGYKPFSYAGKKESYKNNLELLQSCDNKNKLGLNKYLLNELRTPIFLKEYCKVVIRIKNKNRTMFLKRPFNQSNEKEKIAKEIGISSVLFKLTKLPKSNKNMYKIKGIQWKITVIYNNKQKTFDISSLDSFKRLKEKIQVILKHDLLKEKTDLYTLKFELETTQAGSTCHVIGNNQDLQNEYKYMLFSRNKTKTLKLKIVNKPSKTICTQKTDLTVFGFFHTLEKKHDKKASREIIECVKSYC